jgi:G3E family GTPase
MYKTDSHFTKEQLQSLFTYADGNLYWRERKGRRLAGTLAGTASHHYHQICINYVLYRTHRLIWAYHYGPSEHIIDHANNNSFDNRVENLRECFHSQNSQNSRTSKLNTSGVKGVVWCKQKQKWRARIHADGKEFHVGFFDNIKKAEEIMLQKRARLHGVFARVD